MSWIRMIALTCATVAVAMGTAQFSKAGEPPASQPAKAEPMDFRKLKELMPAELAGIKRLKNEGEKVSLGEFKMTTARAEFAKAEPAENDPHITVELMDYAGAKEMGAAMTAWQSMEVDKESDGGYERTVKVKEQPAFETYQNEGKNGQVQIWVAGRFYLNVQAQNLTAENFKKLAESLPIEKLVAAAKEGAAAKS